MPRIGLLTVLVLAITLAGCDRRPASLAQLQAAVRAHPNSVKWRVALGQECLEQGLYHDAHIQFRRALELDNSSFEAAMGLAQAQLKLGDYVRALQAANRAVAIRGDSAAAIALQGEIHLASMRPDKAIGRFQRALQLDPNNEQALTNLPLAYVRAERLDEAFSAAKRAVAALPKSVRARLNLALVRTLRGDIAGAEADLRLARKLDPNDAEPPFRLAELLLQQNRNPQEAYRLAQESAAIDPGDGAVYALQAMALDRMGETNRAVIELKRHVQLHPHNLRLWVLLATLAQQIGDVETARLAATMAVRIGPRPPDKMPSPAAADTAAGASDTGGEP